MMKSDLKTLKNIIEKLAYILTSEQKRGALVVLFSMVICSLLELLGVSTIYPFLDLLMSLGERSDKDKWYFKIVYRITPDISFDETVVLMGVFIILVYIIKNVITLLCLHIRFKFSARFKREMSTLMLASYLRRPYEFFVNNSSAEILRGVNGDTTHTYQILSDMFDFLTAFFTALMIGVYLLYTDWFVAIASLSLAVLCFLFIVFGFKKKMKRAGLVFIDATTKQYKYSYQAVNAIKEIIVADRRECFIDQYESAAREYEEASVTNSFLSACPDRLLEGICVGGFIGIACVRFVVGGDLNSFIPVMGAFAMGAFKILPSISKMSTRINSIVYQQPSLYSCYDNIKEARRLEKIWKSNNNPESALGKERERGRTFQKELLLENLSWTYQNADNYVINDLNLKIEKGQAIALIGASGAGKTTLADIILGLYHPQKGMIKMDGIDVFSVSHLWAKTIGYVPQAVFLIDDTIRANIAFGLPGSEIDDKRIWRALEMAQLSDFVKTLSSGLSTLVGERGIKFSGGQRQRIAIARALYDDPEILILDEATSALDTETETAIMESIDALMGKKTLIIIAHRMTTIRNCDKVYQMRDGGVVERDKDEVMSRELFEK